MLTALRARLRETLAGLSGKAWFPQVPIALGVALLGLLHLIPVIDQAIGLHLHLRTPGSVRQDLVGIDLSGISQLSIGVFLLLMSFGLWLRSRIAWLLSVLAAVIGLAHLYLLSEIAVNAWLLGYDILLMGFLLATYRHFDRSSMRLGTLVALAAVVVLFGYAVLGTYHRGGQFSPHIDTLPEAVYVAVVTMSTVGFGDFTPNTPGARLFLVAIIILSITVFSTAIGATLIPALVQRIELLTVGRHSRVIRKNHYIIVGYSALSSNTYQELVSRDKQVTVILLNESDRNLFPSTDVDIVIGDGADLDTLRRAGAEKAKAILALLDDDSENAFVVLAAKELKIKARTVAAVNDAKHLNRVRRVHPDLIIAPQVLGGELLTSMLTGEKIDVKDIMSHLLGHTDTRKQSE
jgi:voltage-gated potassium channel